jgi:ribose/xylose/arabinose/galactoside ABC-type transport system permease subunit
MSKTFINKIGLNLKKHNLLVMLLIVMGISTYMTGGVYFRPSNLLSVISRASVVGIMALGQALVIISGGFDLSVGSLLAFAVTVIATVTANYGLFAGTIMGMIATTMLGAVNGVLVVKTRVPPFIVTIGMMTIARSISWIIIAGRDVIFYYYKDLIQPVFIHLPGGANLFPVLILICAAIGIGFVLHYSKIGRYIYAIGSNERAAVASGIPVKTVKIFIYALSGFLCSIAAIVYLYRFTGASPAIGEEFLLQTIAAVTLGGGYMYGGEGSVWGVMVGIFVLVSITNVLNVAGIPPTVNKAVLGGIVLVAVLLQNWLKESSFFAEKVDF